MAEMAECPACETEIDVTNTAAGKTIKCTQCGVKLEVIKDGKKKELMETDVEWGDE